MRALTVTGRRSDENSSPLRTVAAGAAPAAYAVCRYGSSPYDDGYRTDPVPDRHERRVRAVGDGRSGLAQRAPVEDLQDALELGQLPGQDEHEYTTVAGFMLHHLGRIPRAADHFVSKGHRFEVVDMDGRRVEKVLVRRTGGRDERI